MNYCKLYLLLIIMLLTNTIIGQSKIDRFSLNPKLGLYNLSNDDAGSVVGGEVYIMRKGLIYSADYYSFKEMDFVFGDSPEEYYNQVGIMIGKYSGEKLFRFQYQGGVATFWGMRRTEFVENGGLFSGDVYEEKDFFTAGLVIKLGFKIIPLKQLGFGLDFQANINPENPIFMTMFSIEIGNLRSKVNKP